ncbi:MAG: hypothetical protein CFH34_01573 [Alphaproteobacteria bacterium MarineAlpha9_Bin4]|nr:hypothetical protein [Pelagibacterales bacterium]PPR25126.1 MAG: hypothetical protein CFH34_01573 [Alphaproteobacteria bacterium MarineAlpha9_Bin4]
MNDKSFSEESFLKGAKKAFKIIVSSYKENNINEARNLLSPKVFDAFQGETSLGGNNLKSFQITELKASVIKIEVIKKIAKIKVLFESSQRSLFEKKTETLNVKDIWTFEKIIESNNPNWVLAEVTTE